MFNIPALRKEKEVPAAANAATGTETPCQSGSSFSRWCGGLSSLLWLCSCVCAPVVWRVVRLVLVRSCSLFLCSCSLFGLFFSEIFFAFSSRVSAPLVWLAQNVISRSPLSLAQLANSNTRAIFPQVFHNGNADIIPRNTSELIEQMCGLHYTETGTNVRYLQ